MAGLSQFRAPYRRIADQSPIRNRFSMLVVMRILPLAFLLLASLNDSRALGASLVLNSKRLHLGAAGSPEWEWFAGDKPDARRLDLRFPGQANSGPSTLFIRQDDVKQDWLVELNGRKLGKLFLMEADLIHTIPIPPGVLRDGDNVLSILPPQAIDDIVLEEIRLDPRPLPEAVHEATLFVNVTEVEGGQSLPCRLTIVDARGALAPLVALTNATPVRNTDLSSSIPEPAPIALRPGVVYTGSGQARVGIRTGDYTVYASRGFEYGIATQRVHLANGRMARVALQLRHEVKMPGWISCDTHVHTLTFSGHGDATLEERMLTIAGEGIELSIATEHNFHADYSQAARRAGVAKWFTPVTGNEVTTAAGHFNIFPIAPGARVPDFHLTDWPALMTELRATRGAQVIILNHPRSTHNGFQPFAATNFNGVTGENLRGPEFSFDALELLNSSAQQTDFMLVYHDWFALLNYGYRITAVGSSDSHDVSRFIVGQARTYIPVPFLDDRAGIRASLFHELDPAHIDIGAACSNLLAGRATVCMGLLAQMTVGDQFSAGDLAQVSGKQVRVTVRVLGPSWVTATNVALFANGVKIQEKQLSFRTASAAMRIEKASVSWQVPRPAHDVYLVAVATGPPVTAPFWATSRPYQPISPRWQGRVIGSTNPIWLDADGDGQFTCARAYARRLVSQYGAKPAQILPALNEYDEAVAAQAASLCAAGGQAPDAPQFIHALKSAAVQVRAGFAAYLAERR